MTLIRDYREELARHKRDNEWFFCASVFSGSAQIALNDAGWLTPDHFSTRELAKYWASVITHGDGVRAANDLGMIDEFITQALRVPDLSRVDEYARAIVEDSYLLNVSSYLPKIVKSISAREMVDLRNMLDLLAKEQAPTSKDGVSALDLNLDFTSLLGRPTTSVSSFLPDVDKEIGGFFGSELTVLASRPGTGKTQLVLQIAHNAAAAGKKVLFFSLEMAKNQLWARLACPLAGLEWKDVRVGMISKTEMTKLINASSQLSKKLGDNFIVSDDVYDVFGIHTLALKHNPDIVIIDQLPDIKWHEKDAPEMIWYGRACKYLRDNIARALNIPLVLVHQINRRSEERQDKRPTMADLRWSGEIEQRADVILLAHRDDRYNARSPFITKVQFEIIFAKNRQGPDGTSVYIEYDLKRQWFT